MPTDEILDYDSMLEYFDEVREDSFADDSADMDAVAFGEM